MKKNLLRMVADMGHNEMEDNRDGPLQLISVENYFQHTRMSNIQVLCWNLIDFSILMFQF